jgi:serine/threonine protein kinase
MTGLVAQLRPRPGHVLAGRYTLIAEIGTGEEAQVWRAEHAVVHKPVVLKRWRLPRRLTDGDGERFLNVARAQTRIDHPGVVEILDGGFDQHEHAFLVMHALGGETLEQRLERGRLDDDEAFDIFEQLLDALAAAHRTGIVHRDLKPANVFLAQTATGAVEVKVLDFGVALSLNAIATHLTPRGILFGTPAYMAPEQLESSTSVGPAADVWAIGIMLHEALTGRAPERSSSVATVIAQARQGGRQRAPNDLNGRWDKIITRCLQPSIASRFANAGDALAALRASRPQQRALGWIAAAVAAVAMLSFLSAETVIVPLMTGNLGYRVYDRAWSVPIEAGSVTTFVAVAALAAFMWWRRTRRQAGVMPPGS